MRIRYDCHVIVQHTNSEDIAIFFLRSEDKTNRILIEFFTIAEEEVTGHNRRLILSPEKKGNTALLTVCMLKQDISRMLLCRMLCIDLPYRSRCDSGFYPFVFRSAIWPPMYQFNIGHSSQIP